MANVKCAVCEMEYGDSLSRCPYCGTNSPLLSNKIRIVRDNHLYGLLAVPDILIDGVKIGSLKSGETLETSIVPGRHELQIITYSDNGKWVIARNRYEYIIKKSCTRVTIRVGMKSYVMKHAEFIVESVIGL